MSTTEEKEQKYQIAIRALMQEYLDDLEKNYNITIYEWCKAKTLIHGTVRRFLRGESTRPKMVKKILMAAGFSPEAKDK